jgi:hypothetical protein
MRAPWADTTCHSDVQALEGPPVDVDAVVDALMAADLSPAALAAAEAASSRPPARKPPGVCA